MNDYDECKECGQSGAGFQFKLGLCKDCRPKSGGPLEYTGAQMTAFGRRKTVCGLLGATLSVLEELRSGTTSKDLVAILEGRVVEHQRRLDRFREEAKE